MKSAFASYHPVVNFIYFIAVISFTMILMNPFFLLASVISAYSYSVVLKGKKSVKENLLYMLPLVCVMAVLNPVFNHQGITILTYLPDGNPLTAESVFYGLAAAVMVASVICWFSCFNCVMTSDKITYLFGKAIPSLALIFSMTLRFIPKFIKQTKAVADAQKTIGNNLSDGSLIQRTKAGISVISSVITWSLEEAIETSDSMRARGYGLPNRTSFSIFRFTRRDVWTILTIIFLSIYILVALVRGNVSFSYFPSISGAEFTPYTISVYAAFLLLCMVPVIIEAWEGIKWKSLKQKI